MFDDRIRSVFKPILSNNYMGLVIPSVIIKNRLKYYLFQCLFVLKLTKLRLFNKEEKFEKFTCK